MIIKEISRPDFSSGIVIYGKSDTVLDAAWSRSITLTQTESVRMSALVRESDRRDFWAAHVLARSVAAKFTGMSVHSFILHQRCASCGGPHGKPIFREYPSLGVSLSHTSGVVAAACSNTSGGIGIDVESWDKPDLDRTLLELVLSPAELDLVNSLSSRMSFSDSSPPARTLAFLRLWVRKESLVKFGMTVLEDLHMIDLSSLPLESFGEERGAWHEYYNNRVFSEWNDRVLQVSGSAVGNALYEIALVQG